LPPVTAMNAARSATSVLPKPIATSGHRLGEIMSWMTAWIAAFWSAVSSKPKSLANTS
jgi:hypothetical protein